MVSVKNVPAIMKAIQDGSAPPTFSVRHLASIGFKSTTDRAVIPVLKDLKFLSEDGKPTPRYHAYRDKSQAKAVLGQALKDAYEELFHINEKPTEQNRAAIEGKFKATHNVSDNVAEWQARTFFAFLKLADLEAASIEPSTKAAKPQRTAEGPADDEHASSEAKVRHSMSSVGLRYNIEIHLPPTKDVEVYNAIFKSLKDHLLDH
jgi:hypothetical protein